MLEGIILRVSRTILSAAVEKLRFLRLERVGLRGCCPMPDKAVKQRISRNSIRHNSVNRPGFSGSVKMRLFIVEMKPYLLKTLPGLL